VSWQKAAGVTASSLVIKGSPTCGIRAFNAKLSPQEELIRRRPGAHFTRPPPRRGEEACVK
jgi:hypothetical protein